MAHQYKQYMSIVDEYLLEFSSEQINISYNVRRGCCSLVNLEDFVSSSALARKNVLDRAVAEVHDVVRSNLYMDVRNYLKDHLFQEL